MSRYRLLAILLVLLHLGLATGYSIINPLGEAPDEADHWAYIVYLAQERRLPEGPRVTQSKHPPFYHASAAAIASLATPSFDFLRANPDVAIHPGPTQSHNFFIHTAVANWPWREGVLAFHLARLWSVVLSTLTVAATYQLARAALPAQRNVALLATGLVATLPEFAFIGGALNNDNAAALFGALALWGGFAIYRRNGAWQAAWWTPLALGLGLLSKASTLSLGPVVGLCILLGAARSQASSTTSWRKGWRQLVRHWPRWVLSGLVIFLPALSIAAPWLLRNWQLYGDPSGMALARQTIDLRTTAWGWAETQWLLTGWFASFWGKFGAVGHIPFPSWVYVALGIVSAVGVVGLARAWWRDPHARIPLLLLGGAAIAVAFGMWRYSLIALGTDQGRLLFPAIAPLLLLLAVGLAGWPWGKSGFWLGSALVAALTFLSLYGLFDIIRPAFAPPALPPASEVSEAVEDRTPLDFGELTLAGWTLDTHPTLYWHAAQPPTQDWRTSLRVTAEDGTLVWEWRRSPGYGRFSSDRWPANTTIRDDYRVDWPEWAAPGRYRVEVTLYAFGREPGQDYPYKQVGWLQREK